MDMKLTRNDKEDFGIFGTMFDDQGNEFCVTLEHAFLQEGGSYAPKVPAGVYNCIRRLSPKFGYDVFMLENVPNATYIEIHVGNYNADSDGCILLGSARSGEMIVTSRPTFAMFMSLQTGVDQFTLTIE